VDAFDGAAERLGLDRGDWFSGQDRIQSLAEPLRVHARDVHVVINGSVIAQDAGAIDHVTFRSDLRVEAVGDDVVGILVNREREANAFGMLADFAGRFGSIRVHEDELTFLGA